MDKCTGPYLRKRKTFWLEAGRHLLGVEQLWSLGIPRSLTFDMSDSEARSASGNGMSLKVLAVLFVKILECVDFDVDLTHIFLGEPPRQKPIILDPIHIGPHHQSEPTPTVYLPGLQRSRKGPCKVKQIFCIPDSMLPAKNDMLLQQQGNVLAPTTSFSACAQFSLDARFAEDGKQT